MQQLKQITALIAASIIFAACQKETTQSGRPQEELATSRSYSTNAAPGHVYTLSNQAAGNRVIDYVRSASGELEWSGSYSAGGNGTGGGLGNQGALIFAGNGSFLLAINAASNSIASLKITSNGLALVGTVNSGGITPVSITQYGNYVFVLNAGGTGNISGFMMDPSGLLSAINGSTKPLSSAMAGGAQVSFVQDGQVLVVTEKATNKIISYTVNSSGIPGMMHSIMAANSTPFGFAVGHNNNIYVTEAAGGNPAASTVSSYHVGADGSISLNVGPVSAGQTAACWAVATNNGKYVYATNTADNTVSSFAANASGNLDVLEAVAGHTQGGPIDAALSNNSKFLYTLNAGGHSISAFTVDNSGGINNIQTVMNLPVGATGLAAK